VQALERPYRLADQVVVPHASLGIALATEGVDTDELIRNADIAMYTAKADETRRLVFYEPSFHARLRRRRELALELEAAVERGEIEVHFQPVIALADGSVHAFEALSRWRHPYRGLLGGADFIPVAEESGLITEIGAEMLRSACLQAGAWQDAAPSGRNVGVWINVSPAEFGNDHLVEDLAIAITTARIDPQQVTVEVTESSVIRDARQSTETLQRLRSLGVSVSIDDFGTGYSSLSRLGELPIDMLKIPKPFVDRLAGDAPDVAIVDAILRLASSLGLTVVAEGVETEDQVARLRELGCGLVQGHFFGRAQSGDETLRLLRHASSHEARPRLR
jgi:EAL domain-containing protein (putative c-di-GMP-specific phosphodiesterase class I)